MGEDAQGQLRQGQEAVPGDWEPGPDLKAKGFLVLWGTAGFHPIWGRSMVGGMGVS